MGRKGRLRAQQQTTSYCIRTQTNDNLSFSGPGNTIAGRLRGYGGMGFGFLGFQFRDFEIGSANENVQKGFASRWKCRTCPEP